MQNRSLILGVALVLLLSINMFAQGKGKTYADKGNGFTVSYPADFKIGTGAKADTEHYFGDPGSGKKLFKAYPRSIPEKYHGDYEFNIWVSDDGADKCGEPEKDENSDASDTKRPKTKMVDGHSFFTYTTSDAGMSKSMSVDGVRGIVNGKCWQIQSVTEQVYAFDHTTPFNQKILDKAFANFVASFRFTK